MKPAGLSVCIPVFTDSLLARYAVESVQGVADEVLVYRDGPQEDACWPQFQAFAAKYRNVRIVEGKTHLGYMVKNALLQEAMYRIVHFCDTDEMLNENYLDQYGEAIRFTEKHQCITVLPVLDLHGDVDHHSGELTHYDTSHSLAYWSPDLRWDNQTPADQMEHIYGARVFLFPTGTEVPSSEYIEDELTNTTSHEPMMVHLTRVKENRLIAARVVAYEYQAERPACTIDEYILRCAGAAPDTPKALVFEKAACEWLNSWGRGLPLTVKEGKMPARLQKLRAVVRCTWHDGSVVRRDDSGWDPRWHW